MLPFSPNIYKTIVVVALTFAQLMAQAQPKEQFIQGHSIHYGTDDFLSLGNPYRPIFRRAKGHPYFVTSNPDPSGTIWVKGVEFEHVSLMYDLELDQVVAKITLGDSSTINLVLEPEWLDSFQLRKHRFINSRVLKLNGMTRDHLAMVYSGKDTFLLEFRKSFLDTYNKSTPNGRYSKLTQRLLLIHNTQLISLNSKRNLFKQFPEKKEIIKNFLRSNKLRYRQVSLLDAQKIAVICEEG